MMPRSFELPPQRRPEHVPHSGRQQSTVTLHGERVLGTTIHSAPFPVAMPLASPSTHPGTWKAKPACYIPPCHSCTLAGGTLPGMPFDPKALLRAPYAPRASPGRYRSLQALHWHYQAFGGLRLSVIKSYFRSLGCF